MLVLLFYAAVAAAVLAVASRSIRPIGARERLVLGLLPLLPTGAAHLTGTIYAPIDLVYGSPPFAAVRPLAEGPLSPGILTEVWTQNIPWQFAVRHAYALGEWPLWNPFILGGDPLAGSAQPAPYSPFLLATLWLPLPQALSAQATLAFFAAALLAWLLLSDLGLSAWAAMLGAAGWMLSNFVVFWQQWPLGVATGLLPGLFLAARLLVRSPGWRSAFTLGAMLALLTLVGHPETAAHGVAFAAVWVAVEWWLVGRRQTLRILCVGAATGGVAFVLLAVYLLPILEVLPQSLEQAWRSNPALWKYRSDSWPDLARHLAGQFVPFLYAPRRGEVDLGVPDLWRLPGTGYVGSLLLPLAVWGAVAWRDPRKWLVLAFGLLGLAAGVKTPLVSEAVALIPLFDVSLNERMIFLFAFAVTALAAAGLDAWLAERDRRLPLLAAGVALLHLAAAALLFAPLRAAGFPDSYLATAIFAWTVPPLALAVVLARAHVTRTAALALGLLLVQRQLEVGRTFPLRAPELFAPAIAPLDRIPVDPTPFRIVGKGYDLVPPTGAFYGFEDTRGRQGLTFLRLFETFRFWSHPLPSWFNRVDDLEVPFLDFLNVRYALTSETEGAVPRGWEEIARGSGTRLLRNREALERASVPPRVRVGGDGHSRLAEMAAARDFAAVAWISLENEPHPTAPREADNGPGRVSIRSEGLGYRLVAELERESWIAVAVTAWRGWRATLAGRELPLAFANHAFLAVRAPAGRSEIELRYRPRSFLIGRAISATAAGVLLLAAVVALFRRRRRA